MSSYKSRMAEHYQDFDPDFINRLSFKDYLWLVCFVNGYHNHNKECLDLLDASDEMRSEAYFMSHSDRRSEPNMNRKRKLKYAYTADDYVLESISPEDALIDAIDYLNSEFAA
jgi:hypothetical protein